MEMNGIELTMLQQIKKIFKKSAVVKHIVAFLLFAYLQIVYLTTRWVYVYANKGSEIKWRKMSRVVAVAWHDRLAMLPKSILHQKKKMHILSSPHSDGIIISSVLRMFGFQIIRGSTNKNPILAVKGIMNVLKSSENVAITPDGPRGPRYKINSNVIAIAKKCNAAIVPVSCSATNYFSLKSWDKLMFPLPFGKVTVYIGEVIEAYEVIDEEGLEQKINELYQIPN
jgi:lysophospholipid acyltransferase (LPLAT)-like uncharacterized protein